MVNACTPIGFFGLVVLGQGAVERILNIYIYIYIYICLWAVGEGGGRAQLGLAAYSWSTLYFLGVEGKDQIRGGAN